MQYWLSFNWWYSCGRHLQSSIRQTNSPKLGHMDEYRKSTRMLSRVSVTTPHSDHDLSKEAMLSSDFRYLFSVVVPWDIEKILSRVFFRQLNRLNPRINMSHVELLFSAKSWSCQVTPWSRQRSFLWVVSRAAVRLVILRFFFTLDYILHIWSVKYTYEAYCTYGYYFTQKVETM